MRDVLDYCSFRDCHSADALDDAVTALAWLRGLRPTATTPPSASTFS